MKKENVQLLMDMCVKFIEKHDNHNVIDLINKIKMIKDYYKGIIFSLWLAEYAIKYNNILFTLVKYYLLSSSASTFSELLFVKFTGLVNIFVLDRIVVRFPVQSLSNFQNLA